MNLKLKTTNISLSPSISDYLEKKVRTIKKFIDIDSDDVVIQVELARTTNHHRTGDIYRAEMNLYKGSHTFTAVAEEEDLYKAIDIAKDELTREVKTNKEKRISVVRRGASRIKNIVKGFSWKRGRNE